MSSIAIVGTGIAGMGCAHFLHRDHDVTLYEQNGYVGGHTNTVEATEPGTGRAVPIDTGFMVYNEVTYPLLNRLFHEIGAPVKKTDMSFSVRHAQSGLEFCGSSINHLFAQRRNLLRPSFWRMLRAIDRFNREAVAALDDPATGRETLAEYVGRRDYGDDFLRLYLVPMSSAVWSTPPEQMLKFPATTLLRFFHNHGFLGLHTQHQWWTVDGGSREYRERLVAPWRDRIHIGDPVCRIERSGRSVRVRTRSGSCVEYDRVVVATHADQALRLLDVPTSDERRLLSAFRYQHNVATLHTDINVMPRTRRAWASWNYQIQDAHGGPGACSTHYWMNSLQGVSDRENYFVSIDRPEAIAPGKVLRRIDYEHPLFSLEAIQAQPELPELNARAAGTTETYFAGSYFRYGFHEDAFASAHDLARSLLGRDPWRAPALSEQVVVSSGV
ncbi:FAD-dependent oxidoreductase [Opitutales bacterium ASA1]|uniref:NAD(P)/FAD-dependent oxidoreductase n=1 Tax=Congregicoccus parvus TaxID=3081749 RepID=UPI002B2DBFE9|nr:FAD-dependent oxidoreductase [Opitutales bacterium ASA1]